ncbi:MAG: hypothetical protein ACLT3Y_02465 [Ruminococcus callidus]
MKIAVEIHVFSIAEADSTGFDKIRKIFQRKNDVSTQKNRKKMTVMQGG